MILKGQLHEIMSHIEDLEEINGRVRKADLPIAYHEPLPSGSNDIEFR